MGAWLELPEAGQASLCFPPLRGRGGRKTTTANFQDSALPVSTSVCFYEFVWLFGS